jgi:hypothetical protein
MSEQRKEVRLRNLADRTSGVEAWLATRTVDRIRSLGCRPLGRRWSAGHER